MPWSGLRPARHSSPVNMPVTWPWWRSRILDHAWSRTAAVAGPPVEPPRQGRRLRRHRGVHDVLRPLPQPAPRRRHGHVLGTVEGLVVDALGAELAGEVEEPRLGRRARSTRRTPGRGPRTSGTCPSRRAACGRGHRGRPQAAAHGLEDARVARRLVVLDERLVREQDRPQVVALHRGVERVRAVPAVRPRWCSTMWPTCRARRSCHRPVVEQERERDRAVEPVRRALPALGRPAEPLALGDVGPELVEVAGQPVGLDPQLAREPAARADRPERQRPERWLGEAGVAAGRRSGRGTGCRGCRRGHAGRDARQELTSVEVAHAGADYRPRRR